MSLSFFENAIFQPSKIKIILIRVIGTNKIRSLGVPYEIQSKMENVKTHEELQFRPIFKRNPDKFHKQFKVPTAMENSHMLEYVIEINFIPKIPLTRPD